MINARAKGAAFERQVVSVLNDFFEKSGIDFVCERNLEQVRTGNQCDILIPFHSIECKHYKQASFHWFKQQWWNQAVNAASGRIPVLVFKYNRVPTRVVIPMYAINTGWHKDNEKIAVISFDEWLRVMSLNWSQYAMSFRANGNAPVRTGGFRLTDHEEYRRNHGQRAS